ncbi:MAG: SpoIID/LytB domain-containing protein [Leptospiraceae bacterium]|nr:SpoIID/LytB domain-containing protein [Leptospiraceae bacterium]MCP5493846.1 SpoIID/LytB domain-containing protein [Leptospiraceae bacterium]
MPNAKQKITIINVLGLEDYLLSVVPSEVFSDWPMDSLKAQAICSRTYTISEMFKNNHKPYHLVAGTGSQMYLGMSKETPKTTKAVESTRNLILLYKGTPAKTFYHSHSGGKTEDSVEVWGEGMEYLKPKELKYCKSAENQKWEATFLHTNLKNKFQKVLGIGDFEDIKILSYSYSGRVKQLEITHKNGEKIKINAKTFRKMFGNSVIQSLFFSITKVTSHNSYLFQGKGFGHGVGLSQWGAYCMARHNSDYKEILDFYFSGTKLVRIRL